MPPTDRDRSPLGGCQNMMSSTSATLCRRHQHQFRLCGECADALGRVRLYCICYSRVPNSEWPRCTPSSLHQRRQQDRQCEAPLIQSSVIVEPVVFLCQNESSIKLSLTFNCPKTDWDVSELFDFGDQALNGIYRLRSTIVPHLSPHIIWNPQFLCAV